MICSIHSMNNYWSLIDKGFNYVFTNFIMLILQRNAIILFSVLNIFYNFMIKSCQVFFYVMLTTKSQNLYFSIRTHYSTEKSVYLLFSILIKFIIIFEYFFPYYNNSKQIKIPVFGTKLNCPVTNQKKNLSTMYFWIGRVHAHFFGNYVCGWFYFHSVGGRLTK